ncbi:MAG: cofactor-independent phosphoglycerate mutase [Clostridia bacterium]|nr:cofactor-independent phosphoglycerate mutase [Clostridia bacterium]
MKYAVILGDGMAGYPMPERENKTCLQCANKRTIDSLARMSKVGTAKTVPQGFKPGSDVANLSVMGYAPAQFYTGRSPLEAASIGIPLKDTDVTLRCNLVTLSDAPVYAEKRMIDYSAGEISTEEARELIVFLKEHFDRAPFTLFAGISYRHCLVVENGKTGHDFTPPHDISDRVITDYLPKGEGADAFLAMMERSYELLRNHPVNVKRVAEGKNPANSVWFWGEGTKPSMQPFESLYGKKGGVISAVDLVKGLGILSGMKTIEVDGATGNWDTNFSGKANAAADALLGGLDFVYVHMEAPDECGHHGDAEKKIYSIEQVDGVVNTILSRMRDAGERVRLLILPDHPTPICLKTHTSDPVPFLLYDSGEEAGNGANSYCEEEAQKTGLHLERGWELIQLLFDK